MALSKTVVYKRRATITDLPLYHSGPLAKKYTGDQDFKRCYGEVRGSTLFMYEDERQDTYTDKVDLQLLKHMATDVKWRAFAIFTLSLEKYTLKMKIDNVDTAEEWRGVILTVANKKIPSNLNLLPGQMMKLEEILRQESRRQAPPIGPPLPPRPLFLTQDASTVSTRSPLNAPEQRLANMPPCFYNVTRQQAEQMLQDDPEYGSIILRPSTLDNNYAVTIRQLSASGPVIKNYRVTATKSGFVVELDSPVEVESLEQVLLYIIEQTEHRLQPYVKSHPYDTRIELPPVPKCNPTSSSPTARVLPQVKVAPLVFNQYTVPTSKAEHDYVMPYEKLLKQEDVKDNLHKILQDGNFSSC